jgi:hypothetical protein
MFHFVGTERGGQPSPLLQVLWSISGGVVKMTPAPGQVPELQNSKATNSLLPGLGSNRPLEKRDSQGPPVRGDGDLGSVW